MISILLTPMTNGDICMVKLLGSLNRITGSFMVLKTIFQRDWTMCALQEFSLLPALPAGLLCVLPAFAWLLPHDTNTGNFPHFFILFAVFWHNSYSHILLIFNLTFKLLLDYWEYVKYWGNYLINTFLYMWKYVY